MMYEQILDRYEGMLANIQPLCESDPGTSLRHTRWMIQEMRTFTNPFKFMRWLGFVQHSLIENYFTTVTAERDFTRPIFKDEVERWLESHYK